MTTAGAGTGTHPPLRATSGPETRGLGVTDRWMRNAPRWTWWAAVPFALVYLILLAHQLGTAITATNLDADAASGPVIGELFGAAPAHANVVLGEFGWYATLLFDLGTKWLPGHRQIWEGAPYAMALAGAGLVAWSVWRVAGRWAAGLTAVLLICSSPATLRLQLSTTQHAPAWFCLALLGAFVIWLEQRAAGTRRLVLIVLVLVIGTIVGVNAASDPLVIVAAAVPFALALALVRRRGDPRAAASGVATLAVAAVTWGITRAVMSALSVTPEPGLHPTKIVLGHRNLHNLKLWGRSIAVLGNGAVSGGSLSPRLALAAVCAAVSIAAVLALPWLSWRQLRRAISSSDDPARHAFFAYWFSSAALLTLAFILSDAPVDIHADRYLVGLLSAAAAVVPAGVALAGAASRAAGGGGATGGRATGGGGGATGGRARAAAGAARTGHADAPAPSPCSPARACSRSGAWCPWREASRRRAPSSTPRSAPPSPTRSRGSPHASTSASATPATGTPLR